MFDSVICYINQGNETQTFDIILHASILVIGYYKIIFLTLRILNQI